MSIITKNLVLISFAIAFILPVSALAYGGNYGTYGAYSYMPYGSSQNGYSYGYPSWGNYGYGYGYTSMVGMTAPSRTFYLYPYSPVMYNYSYPFANIYGIPYSYGYYSYPYTMGGFMGQTIGGYPY